MNDAIMTMGAGPGDVEDGTYDLTCTNSVPKTFPGKVHPQYNPEGHDSEVFVWSFNFTGSDQTVEGVTSKMTGPKSKTARFVGALLGAAALQPGASYSAADFVGKRALGQIVHNKDGYPKVDELFPLPKEAAKSAAPSPALATPPKAARVEDQGKDVAAIAAVVPVAASIREQADEAGKDLPF